MASAMRAGTPSRARRVGVSMAVPVRVWCSAATLRACSTRAAGTVTAGGAGVDSGAGLRSGIGRVLLVLGVLVWGRTRGRVGEEGSAEEGDRGPASDEDAQPCRHLVQVEESGGGDVRPEGGREGDDEPAPPRRFRVTSPQSAPGGDEQQIDGDGIRPGLPSVLTGRRGDVVQVGERQCCGDDRLDEHRVDTGQLGAHAVAPSGFRHGRGRDLARGCHADRGGEGVSVSRSRGAAGVPGPSLSRRAVRARRAGSA